MPSNPYASPSIEDATMPRRLRQGRTAIAALVAIILVVHLWEIGWLVIWRRWSDLLFPLVRFIIPVALVYVIWRGHNWARFVLAAYCFGILYTNLSVLEHIPEMYAAGDWPSLTTVSLLFIGNALIATSVLFSGAITQLIAFRLEEADLRC